MGREVLHLLFCTVVTVFGLLSLRETHGVRCSTVDTAVMKITLAGNEHHFISIMASTLFDGYGAIAHIRFGHFPSILMLQQDS